MRLRKNRLNWHRGIRWVLLHRKREEWKIGRKQEESKLNRMKLKAYAKINLGLDVVGKREDGYHEVRMIMQTIGLYDRICLTKSRKSGIKISTNLFYLPINEDNLVYRAAKVLFDEFHIKGGLEIDLQKYIPVAAGMAGGSSDAASVLYGINRMYRLGLSLDELMERGVKLGADIPYCLLRGTALSEGIGEKLTPLPAVPNCWVLVAKPSISVSTKFVYENLRVDELQHHPDIDGMIEAIEKQDLYGVADKLENVLETVTIPNYPVIADIKEHIKNGGAINALMSGSGPTVFGLFDSREKAQAEYKALKEMDLARQLYLTRIYQPRKV